MNAGKLPASCRKGFIVAAAAIIPFTSWGPAPWLMVVFLLLVSAVYLIDFATVFSSRRFSFRWSPLWVPFVLLYSLSLYHLARSPVPYSSLLFLSQFTVCLFFFHLLLCCETSLPTRAVVLTWVGVLVTWVLVETVIFGSRQPGGPFLNPNYLSTIILSCLAYLAGSLADTKGMSKTGWVLAFSSLICTAGLVIIGSRSAALGILLISIFLMIRGKGLIRLTAVAVIAAILLAPSTVHHRVTQGYREDPHAFTRIEIWQAALKMGMDHPVAGVGPNLFYEHSPVYAFPVDELPVRYGRIVRKPHNEYLRSWAEGGLIGIAAAGFFLFFTLQLVVRSWRRGNTGPPLAMCAVLFQALFHDITEVFALMVLGVWWLSHLVPDGKPRLEVVNRKGVFLGTLMALILAASSIWLCLDVVSRASWAAGRQLLETDVHSAEDSLTRTLFLNPLLPGAARDLAQLHLGQFRGLGTGPSFERAADSILLARKRNRLDTVPLRLQAALYEELARRSDDVAGQALAAAIQDLNRARELEPHNALILVNLADIYWELGRLNQALNQIEQALVKEPNYLAANRKRISWLSEMDRGSVPEARMALEKAVQRAAGYRPRSEYEEIILK